MRAHVREDKKRGGAFMPTPTKSVAVLQFENRSHRTKAELSKRQSAENALLSGVAIKEKDAVKDSLPAHKEFLRIQKLLKAIGKNDALQENVINRYCQIYAEITVDEIRRNQLEEALEDIKEAVKNDEMSAAEAFALRLKIYDHINAVERTIHSKRDMLLRIEKECLMTPAAAMRAVPKKATEVRDENEDMFG
jgi:hypothetical protein